MKTPATHFNRREHGYITDEADAFIAELAPAQTQEVYEALAILIDEFGCKCRTCPTADNRNQDLDTLIQAYRKGLSHPVQTMDKSVSEDVLDEHACPVPNAIVVALFDVLCGFEAASPELSELYNRTAQLLPVRQMHALSA